MTFKIGLFSVFVFCFKLTNYGKLHTETKTIQFSNMCYKDNFKVCLLQIVLCLTPTTSLTRPPNMDSPHY